MEVPHTIKIELPHDSARQRKLDLKELITHSRSLQHYSQ